MLNEHDKWSDIKQQSTFGNRDLKLVTAWDDGGGLQKPTGTSYKG